MRATLLSLLLLQLLVLSQHACEGALPPEFVALPPGKDGEVQKSSCCIQDPADGPVLVAPCLLSCCPDIWCAALQHMLAQSLRIRPLPDSVSASLTCHNAGMMPQPDAAS